MGNVKQCNGCEQLTIQNRVNQAELIEKQLEQYAITNKINKIPRNKRALIQLCFSLRQKHISDRLIQLYNQKNNQDNILFESLKAVNLQEIDQLYYLTRFQEFRLQIDVKQSQIARILTLAQQQYQKQGQKIIKNQDITFITFIDCFVSENTLISTDLTSRKTGLELFLQKIQAFNEKYEKQSPIFIICTQQNQRQVKKIVKNNAKVIVFKPSIPLLSQDGKIILYGDRLKFNIKTGDMIHFFKNNQQILQTIQQKQYLYFCDINNYISNLVDSNTLGYMAKNTNISCMIGIKSKDKDSCIIRNNFIEFPQNLGQLAGDCIMLSKYFIQTTSKLNNNYQLFGRQIKKNRLDYSKKQYYFSRTYLDILYCHNTMVYRCTNWASSAIEYSNYCKQQIGIENQDQQDLVEIGLTILHGHTSKIDDMRRKLIKNSQNIGFPLLILKKQEQ